MDDPVAAAILTQYFPRLELALGDVAPSRRDQILEDIRSHVDEALADMPDRSDASVLTVLDRVGDPEDIAQEARSVEEGDRPGTALELTVPAHHRLGRVLRLGVPVLTALVAVTALVLVLSGSSTSASPSSRALIAGLRNGPLARSVTVAGSGTGTGTTGWLPASDISGGGGIDTSTCTPQTVSGSESVATLEGDASQVASGTVSGQSWTLWSKHGQSGAAGIEDGGLIVDGVAHGLCPGFPNPAEMELLEPSRGGAGLAYGVVGYPGAAKVAIYGDSFGNFGTDKLIASTTSQVASGVGFFITPLDEPACAVSGIELNTASKQYAAEHNLAFASSDCRSGNLVPISNSQGIWQEPVKDFPDHFNANLGAGAGTPGAPTLTKGGWLPAGDISGGGGIDTSDCSPQTLSGSEPASRLAAEGTQVASGSVGGHRWSLWSKHGARGATGIEDGGLIVDGVAHGLCPGFPNPSETELLDPAGGGDGLAYGVVGYHGDAKVAVYRDSFGNFATEKQIASTTSQVVDGIGFYITALDESACAVSGLEVNSASAHDGAEHNLAFNTKRCSPGQLVPISNSQGIWQQPVTDFPDHFNGGGASTSASPGTGGGIPVSPTGPDFSSCSPDTTPAASGTAGTSVADATRVSSGRIDGHRWSLWSRVGKTGSAALEDGGVILGGHQYGLCPGFPNPAELELINPGSRQNGIVIGVSGYTGQATATVDVGHSDSFRAGPRLIGATTVAADGTGFFIGELPKSACDYPWLELNVTAHRHHSSQHNFGFGACAAGKLVAITASMGAWSA
jgi:uncharacterized membrane protein